MAKASSTKPKSKTKHKYTIRTVCPECKERILPTVEMVEKPSIGKICVAAGHCKNCLKSSSGERKVFLKCTAIFDKIE